MSRSNVVRVALFGSLILAIATALVYRDHMDLALLQSWLESQGAKAPFVFVVLYVVATVLFLPGSVLTLAGGALFGPFAGTAYSLFGATLGATLAFVLARYVARDWAARRAGGRLKQLLDGVDAEGGRFVAFVRLVPIFPFNALNYALGLTRISLAQYVVASFICMFPGAAAYTYIGYAGRSAVGGSDNAIQIALVALALLAIVLFLPRLISKLRKRPIPEASPTLDVCDLKRRLDAGERIMVLDVRSAPDFVGELGHIAGATNIPLPELGLRLNEIGDYRKQPVVTICRTERMSSTAARLLAAQGFTDVLVVRQGMIDWNKHGYPIEG
jgi:uncharacterized membrane protein YdjX (TVP38/TMEM64 family)/rhodanese-related sulfurtransferase